MQVFRVNLGRERATDAKASGKTGIYKTPVEAPILVTAEGLKDDVVCDRQHHGGPDQAVYVYGLPDYAWWAGELQAELLPGTFGENLTLTELESASLSVGDRFVIGSLILEVTAPRIPCLTLARRMNDDAFVERFIAAERPGVYCRVLHEGDIRAGDSVTLVRYPGETVTILELFRDFLSPDLSEAAIRRFLAAPIAVRARAHKEAQLQRILAQKR